MKREIHDEAELSTLSRAELVALKEKIDKDIALIDGQLMEARNKVRSSGEYADGDWYRRATIARRLKGQESQRIQRWIGEKNKGRRFTFEQEFVSAAQRLLTGETFAAIKREAWENVNGGDGIE